MPAYAPSGSGNVHYDQFLTNISVAWPNMELVGNQLFPQVVVRKQSDKYYVFNGREAWVPEASDVRSPGAEAHEIPGMKVSTDTYYAQEHALQIAVTDEERENTDSPMSPDRDATELVTSKVLLGREIAMRDMVTTAANYATGLSVTLQAGTTTTSDGVVYGKQWDQADATPIRDIRRAKAKMHTKSWVQPTTAVIPYQVMTALEDSADLIDRIKYSERAILTPELIATLLGLSKVIVPGAGYSSTNVGQAVVPGYIWGKDVILAYVPDRPGLRVPAFGYEFVWGYGGGTPQAVDRWREERRKSDVIRIMRRYDLKFIGVDSSGDTLVGFLFKAAVA